MRSLVNAKDVDIYVNKPFYFIFRILVVPLSFHLSHSNWNEFDPSHRHAGGPAPRASKLPSMRGPSPYDHSTILPDTLRLSRIQM